MQRVLSRTIIRVIASFPIVLSITPVRSQVAQADRIARPIDSAQTRIVTGSRRSQARPEFDRGPADPALLLNNMLLLFQPTAARQADLDRLLAGQQNPSSPDFHKWLTPEEFADRFGVSAADRSKVVAWLTAQGFTVTKSARGRNWIAFSGNAGQVSKSLHAPIHRYRVNGEDHFANAADPSVPEALAPVVAGFMGLDDFHPKPLATKFIPIANDPDYNRGTSHYLAPEDFATIYDLGPLYQGGFDGTGQNIAVVGQSDVLRSDIRSFRSRYNLPANDPKMAPYGADPGFNGAEVEGVLDLEWAGAVAPKATISYIYGNDAFTAIAAAVDLNTAPLISSSYGICEVDSPALIFRGIAQQANAQGITILAASGDSGNAACDSQGIDPFATRGRGAMFLPVLPEVTGVGGTQFNEGNGAYWSSVNSPYFGSALSYMPEIAWNESSPANGLGASGGAPSTLFTKPAWQSGPGVPNDNARDVPDLSLTAALHDSYIITYEGAIAAVGGTSASTQALAGIIAILNQYQVSKGFVKKAGLGNINPQLYRLAQVAPTAFHDITSGDNIVPCAQGTPDCLTGSYGYQAGPGYDLVTGLGSIDANTLVTQWNVSPNPVTVTIAASPSRATLNDNVQLIATVVPAGGSGTPTGEVDFSAGGLELGSAALAPAGGQQSATITFEASRLGVGAAAVTAIYGGDAAFSGGAASAALRVTTPSGVSGIVTSVDPNPVYAAPPDAQGPGWQVGFTLREAAGVPSTVTGFSIDGVTQPLAQYFPSTAIPANGTLTTNVVFRNIAYPLTRTFGFTGIDATGQTWLRQSPVTFLGPQVFQDFNLSATPLAMVRNTTADPSCQWSQQLTLDETGGFAYQVTGFIAGNVDISDRIPSIFGTARLAPWGSLGGTLCWSGITPPATNTLLVQLTDEFGNNLDAEINVSFADTVASASGLSASPASLSLQQGGGAQPAQAVFAVNLADKTLPWTASVFPANRTSAWLTLSQNSGNGSAQITLRASGAGFEPGVYRASIVIECPNAAPQYAIVPVMFVNGGSGGAAISGGENALSFKAVASPGMMMAVYGSQLANSPGASASTLPLPFSLNGVSATVNGLAAPLYYVSPGQLNIQVPYEAGAGPAVLGVNNNGQIAGYQLQIAPSAPGILADASGNLVTTSNAQPGSIVVMYLTGDGDVTPALQTGASPAAGTALQNLPKSRFPFSVTVGGVQAFLEFVGITPGVAGLTQVNFIVPQSISPGPQPIVVVVGGVSSPPVNLTVSAPSGGQ